MTNNGAVSSTLNCGGSYTIPAGYHNGSGKVTANTLSSQTRATATASTIIKGYTAWVNGSKLTGTAVSGATSCSGVVYSSLSYGGSQSHTVTFSTTFSKIPTVIAYNSGGVYINVSASNITTTGCTITISNGSDWQSNINGNWVAFA